jgi:hypothetical protein
MTSTPLADIEVYRQARQIVEGLEAVSVGDALAILNKAIAKILSENRFTMPELDQPVHPLNPNLIRHRKPCKIDNDPELKAFIYRMPTYKTLDEIVTACEEEFGVERAPSRSSLHRYLQGLAKRTQGTSGKGEIDG